MNPLQHYLIQTITKSVDRHLTRKADLERAAQIEDNQVRPVSVYKWVFWTTGLMGLIFGGIACALKHPIIGLFLFLPFALPCAIGLCIQYNCLLVYDEQGFTWRNMLRITHRYSYEEVTGLYCSPLHVVVVINKGKRLDLDKDWSNQDGFAKAIKKYRSEKPPKLPMPILGMSCEEISSSYQDGALSKAMLVKTKDQPKFGQFKAIHYMLGTFSGLMAAIAILCFPIDQNSEMQFGLLAVALLQILCSIASLALYFAYPQYFTVREKPSDIDLPQNVKANHKCCTFVLTSMLGVVGSGVFFVAQLDQSSQLFALLLAACMAVSLFFAVLMLFRRLSWEYRNFRVGYVTFTWCQVVFSLSVFFVLGGLFSHWFNG